MTRQITFRGVLILTMTAVLALSCSENGSVELQAPQAVSVKAVVLQPSSHAVTSSFTGSLEGEQQSDIFARIAEAVERVPVREGDRVSEGQVLIMLDKGGPTSNYRNAESVYRNAEKNYKKMEFLYKEGAVAESQFDAAQTEYEVSKANFEAATQLVDIRSPVTGVVTSLDVSPGDYLRLGQKLATIASMDSLRVKCGANARDIAVIHEGDTVAVTSSATDATLPGKVVSVARSADPETRAFEVEVSIDNQNSLLRPGMFVRVSLVIDQLDDVIVVPHGAVVELNDEPTVFVVENGKARKRIIKKGEELEDGVVIRSGLQAGDTLVTLGQTFLDDGFAVKITSLENDQP